MRHRGQGYMIRAMAFDWLGRLIVIRWTCQTESAPSSRYRFLEGIACETCRGLTNHIQPFASTVYRVRGLSASGFDRATLKGAVLNVIVST